PGMAFVPMRFVLDLQGLGGEGCGELLLDDFGDAHMRARVGATSARQSLSGARSRKVDTCFRRMFMLREHPGPDVVVPRPPGRAGNYFSRRNASYRSVKLA